jgi:hypothetical protein
MDKPIELSGVLNKMRMIDNISNFDSFSLGRIEWKAEEAGFCIGPS